MIPFIGGLFSKFVYIGLSDKQLHLVECDLLSRPTQHRHFPLSSLGPARLTQGILNHSLTLSLPQLGRYTVTVPANSYNQMKDMVNIINSPSPQAAA